MQLGSVVYNSTKAGSLQPGAANNGLSVAGGIVQLGGPAGAATAANLLNNREVPLNNFTLTFSAVGGPLSGTILFKSGFAHSATPMLTFQDFNGNPIGGINFNGGGGSGTGGDISIGLNAGINFNTGGGGQNISIGQGALQTNQTGINNIAIGNNALNAVNGAAGRRNTVIGVQALENLTTGQGNIAIGLFAGHGIPSVNFGIFIGNDTGDTNGAAIGDNPIIIGTDSFDNPGATYGTNLICLGQFTNNGQGSNVGNNVITIGSGLAIGAAAGFTNSIIIVSGGNAATPFGLPNTILMGDQTQNMLLGQTGGAYANNGNRLQISGKLNTGGAAPLTLGAGAMDFGKVVTAASVLNATKYLEMSVDGVLVKVCIN